MVYRSNKLGEDLIVTNTGGGNTSSKRIERDPLTSEEVEVLWIKGSGGDLRRAPEAGVGRDVPPLRRYRSTLDRRGECFSHFSNA